MSLQKLSAAACVLLALVLALAAGRASADEPATLEDLAAAIDRAAQAPDGFRVVVGHMSRTLGVPVEALRAQQTQTGLGWGELLIANRLARRASLPFDQVVAEFGSGKRWADIAMAHAVDLGELIRDVRSSADVVEQREEDQAPRIETPSRPDTTRPPGGRTGRGRH